MADHEYDEEQEEGEDEEKHGCIVLFVFHPDRNDDTSRSRLIAYASLHSVMGEGEATIPTDTLMQYAHDQSQVREIVGNGSWEGGLGEQFLTCFQSYHGLHCLFHALERDQAFVWSGEQATPARPDNMPPIAHGMAIKRFEWRVGADGERAAVAPINQHYSIF